MGKAFSGPGMARGPRVTCTAAPYLPALQVAPEHWSQLESQLEGLQRCVSGESQSQPPPKKSSQLQLFWTVVQVCPSLRAQEARQGCARGEGTAGKVARGGTPAVAKTRIPQPPPIACLTDSAHRRRMRREKVACYEKRLLCIRGRRARMRREEVLVHLLFQWEHPTAGRREHGEVDEHPAQSSGRATARPHR